MFTLTIIILALSFLLASLASFIAKRSKPLMMQLYNSPMSLLYPPSAFSKFCFKFSTFLGDVIFSIYLISLGISIAYLHNDNINIAFYASLTTVAAILIAVLLRRIWIAISKE